MRAIMRAVFDHRQKPQPLFETEIIDGKSIVSYCIPVVQQKPSYSK